MATVPPPGIALSLPPYPLPTSFHLANSSSSRATALWKSSPADPWRWALFTSSRSIHYLIIITYLLTCLSHFNWKFLKGTNCVLFKFIFLALTQCLENSRCSANICWMNTYVVNIPVTEPTILKMRGILEVQKFLTSQTRNLWIQTDKCCCNAVNERPCFQIQKRYKKVLDGLLQAIISAI